MAYPSIDSILTDSEGILLPFETREESSRYTVPVVGLELYQPGTTTDYRDRLVLVSTPVDDQDALDLIIDDCAEAAALVLQPDAVRTLRCDSGPVLLRRSSWVSGETLIRTLAVLVDSPDAGLPSDGISQDTDHEAAAANRRQDSALLALLAGTSDAAVPAAMVGLRLDQDHVVIAAGVPRDDLARFRIALASEFPGERDVVSEGHVLAVLPVQAEESSAAVTRRLSQRMGRLSHGDRIDLPIGVGPKVSGVSRLYESANGARLILRALNVKVGFLPLGQTGTLRVAEADDVEDALAIIYAADALQPHADRFTARLRILNDYDRKHRTDLLPTVLAALKQQTNVAAAARPLGIHPNSLRARLDRITEISGIDLTDHAARLRTMLAFIASPEIHNSALRSVPPNQTETP